MGGYAILIAILVVCIVVAFVLGRIAGITGLSPQEIVGPRGDQPQEDEPRPIAVSNPTPSSGNSDIFPDRILVSFSNALNSYYTMKGRYPNSYGDMARDPDFEIPRIEDDPHDVRIELEPGDFSPGGFSYIPFRLTVGGPYMGYILIGYAGTEMSGVTIENPMELLTEPGIIEERFMKPIRGVEIAIREDGRPIDLSVFE